MRIITYRKELRAEIEVDFQDITDIKDAITFKMEYIRTHMNEYRSHMLAGLREEQIRLSTMKEMLSGLTTS